MKASDLWIFGVLTLGLPYFIYNIVTGTYQPNINSFFSVSGIIGIVTYFVGTRLIDRRYILVRKQNNSKVNEK